MVEPYLREAIERGSAEARRALGSYLIEGRVLKKDVAAGLRPMEEAAEAGDQKSIRALVDDFDRAVNGAPEDARQALHWARLGAATACTALARAGLRPKA